MNERFYKLLSDPVLKAAVVFEHRRWPDFFTSRDTLDEFGEEKVIQVQYGW